MVFRQASRRVSRQWRNCSGCFDDIQYCDFPLRGLSAIASPSRVSRSLGVGPARRFRFTPRFSRLMFPTASADARRLALLPVSDPCLAACLPFVALLHINHMLTSSKFSIRPPARGHSFYPHTALACTLTKSPPAVQSVSTTSVSYFELVRCWSPPSVCEGGGERLIALAEAILKYKWRNEDENMITKLIKVIPISCHGPVAVG